MWIIIIKIKLELKDILVNMGISEDILGFTN